MPKYHCYIHGEYTEYGETHQGCPDCQQAQYDRETSSNELSIKLDTLATQTAAAAIIAAHKTNNPGDYQCPSCKLISLIDGASCCPMCRKDVPSGYWERIREAERKIERQNRQAKADKQRWLQSPEYAEQVRLDSERLKLAREAYHAQNKEEAEKKDAEKKISKRFDRLGCITVIIAPLTGGICYSITDSNGCGVVGLILGGIIIWFIGQRICGRMDHKG